MPDSNETKYLRRRIDESRTARGLAESGGARHSHGAMRNEYQKRLDASVQADSVGRGRQEDGDLPPKEHLSRSHARWEDEGGQV